MGELNDIKVLLAQISGEIDIGEERLKNKLDTTEHLKSMANLKDIFFPAIEKAKEDVLEELKSVKKKLEAKIESAENDIKAVDKRINALYLKVAGATGIIVTLVEIVLQS